MSTSCLVRLGLACLLLAPTTALGQSEGAVAAVEQLIEEGRADEALAQLKRMKPKGDADAARLFLLRSTARFMIGEVEAGRRDLDEALRRDPTLRQGWLNRAGLDIAEGRLDDAREALEEARRLDPEALDNDLNIGALLAMQGRPDKAHPYLQRYLVAHSESADAWYSVATNYALGGQGERAIEHLTRAITMDERSRMRSRTDPNFGALANDSSFQRLLATDSYRIPANSHAIYRIYEETYLAGRGKLLPAVLDALQLIGEPFDRRIEVTADWALIWGEMRIKVRNDSRAGGRVELTAPRSRFDSAEWKSRANRLFAETALQLAKR